jgi:hypothetical protein
MAHIIDVLICNMLIDYHHYQASLSVRAKHIHTLQMKEILVPFYNANFTIMVPFYTRNWLHDALLNWCPSIKWLYLLFQHHTPVGTKLYYHTIIYIS